MYIDKQILAKFQIDLRFLATKKLWSKFFTIFYLSYNEDIKCDYRLNTI